MRYSPIIAVSHSEEIEITTYGNDTRVEIQLRNDREKCQDCLVVDFENRFHDNSIDVDYLSFSKKKKSTGGSANNIGTGLLFVVGEKCAIHFKIFHS